MPSSSSSPSALTTKNQAGMELENGMGKGSESKKAKIIINPPFRICVKRCFVHPFNRGLISFSVLSRIRIRIVQQLKISFGDKCFLKIFCGSQGGLFRMIRSPKLIKIIPMGVDKPNSGIGWIKGRVKNKTRTAWLRLPKVATISSM